MSKVNKDIYIFPKIKIYIFFGKYEIIPLR